MIKNKKLTNTQFRKLKKTEKAVEVAKDVIIQINRRKFIPTHRAYIYPTFNGDEYINTTAKTGSIQKEMSNLIKCECCAIGGMFMSAINLGNSMNFEDSNIYGADACDLSDEKPKKIFESIFNKKDLLLIEACFEGSHSNLSRVATEAYSIHFNSIDEANLCDLFKKSYNNPADIMIAICKNIIRNKGRFIIPKKYYSMLRKKNKENI